MSQTFAGSYISLFSQRLLQAIMQNAQTNPLAASQTSPMISQLDAMLTQNVQSLDGMLSSVGVSVGSGIAPSPVLGGGLNRLM